MSITINIKKTVSTVNIIKDEQAELEQINLIMDAFITTVMNDPMQGEKAKMIGEEKLREMGLQIFKEQIKKNEQEQINYWTGIAEEFSQAMIKGLVKGSVEIANKL